ncbi:hypothetical protein CYL18_04720 [Pradoshia eiseniae]|uniref:4'-phosphopantetheinyl transferase domain-containing protein n=1 Tax=Pradoshia eiseniae TaxID=2064768 RepID=A0A2S7N560_9BACI|nr:4'-phosphopantetheinyl transferase superfamily protein [Pradoshia eiseniae]PQD97179.1 hypothetical protein CYL18_04720 [Pradoshia eiseniae]
MTSVHITRIPQMDAGWLPELIPFLNGRVKDKIRRMRRREDQLRSAAVHAIAQMMLAKQLNVHIADLHYTVNEYGKYGLAGNQLYFNLSHAGCYVACAISHCPVGIDLEERTKREFNLFSSIWSEIEKNQYDLQDRDCFYWLWTAKESYIKYLGIGLYAPMKQITVLGDGSVIDEGRKAKAVIEHLALDQNYTFAVCSEQKINHINVIELDTIRTFYQRNDRLE